MRAEHTIRKDQDKRLWTLKASECKGLALGRFRISRAPGMKVKMGQGSGTMEVVVSGRNGLLL